MSEQSDMLDAQWSSADVADTSTGGYLDTGMKYFGQVANTWLQYQNIKTQHDLEYQNDPLNRARTAAGAVPSWVWIVGVLGVAFVAYKAVR